MRFFNDDIKLFKGQDYQKLKKEHQGKGTLFIDTEFPPDDKSLFFTAGKLANVVWKRPKQICENPKLFVAGTSSGDVSQGRLGNCWFVASCSCLANHKDVWNRVIPDPDQQEWDDEKPDNYCGIFHFRFWRYGAWLDVVIDDFLPTINNELIFIHSQSRNEFWSALLEKAYAKLFGNYEVLDGGELSEALEDFTGGVSNNIDLVAMKVATALEERTALFARMQKEKDRRSLMAAAIPAKSSEEMEASLDSGLVVGHAYGITAVKNIHLEGSGLFGFFNREKLPMIRLRNPWGQCEWKGAFSDGEFLGDRGAAVVSMAFTLATKAEALHLAPCCGIKEGVHKDDGTPRINQTLMDTAWSPEWDKIDKSDREKVGLTFEDDGEFWMTFEDFCKNFVNVSICRVVNTSLFSLHKTWYDGEGHGAWKKPDRAGGCANNRDTFLNNPQFVFDVKETEDECMIQLMQKSIRSKSGNDNNTIGFTILKVEENRKYRLHDLNYYTGNISTVFRNSRSVFLKELLKKGRYAVIPCTFNPGMEAGFLLRVYTASANNFKELIHDKPQKNKLNCCAQDPVLVTRIKVIKAIGLEKQEQDGADPYCVVSCERNTVYTPVVNNTTDPEFNCSMIFYRRNPANKPIKVQIWNKNVLKSTYMGKHIFSSCDDCHLKIQEVNLVAQGKDSNITKPGKLIVEMTTTRNLTSI